jgi:hypothetical protein
METVGQWNYVLFVSVFAWELLKAVLFIFDLTTLSVVRSTTVNKLERICKDVLVAAVQSAKCCGTWLIALNSIFRPTSESDPSN